MVMSEQIPQLCVLVTDSGWSVSPNTGFSLVNNDGVAMRGEKPRGGGGSLMKRVQTPVSELTRSLHSKDGAVEQFEPHLCVRLWCQI